MYPNLEAELARAGVTRGKLCKELGIANSTLTLKLQGRSEISLVLANNIKNFLEVDIPLEVLFARQSEKSA